MMKFNWREYIQSKPVLRQIWNSQAKARLYYVLFKSFNLLRTMKQSIQNMIQNKIILLLEDGKISIFVMILPRLEVYFLEEWIKYHLAIGVDAIYIYDNGLVSKDARKFSNTESPEGMKWAAKPNANYFEEKSDEQIYADLHEIVAKYDQVFLKEWHYPFTQSSDPKGHLPTKMDAYEDCIKNNKSDWWIHIDPDEFLFPKIHGNLKDFLRHNRQYSTFHIKQRLFEERKAHKPILENVHWSIDRDVCKSIIHNNRKLLAVHKSYAYGKVREVPPEVLSFYHFHTIPDKPEQAHLKKYTYTNVDKSLFDFAQTLYLSDKSVEVETKLLKKRKDSMNTKSNKDAVSIIVPIYGALPYVKKLVNTLLKQDDMDFELILYEDFYSQETTDYLKSIKHTKCKVYTPKSRLGYTESVNEGIRESSGDILVVLNSDTIVPQTFVSQLKKATRENEEFDIFGVISNAASYQSVPRIWDNHNRLAVNSMPPKLTLDSLNDFLIENLEKHIIQTRILNGFCFATRRHVFENVGLLDSKNFPRGYYEEVEFFIRCYKNNISLGIIPWIYVYHEKTQSFGTAQRNNLLKQGRKKLFELHDEKIHRDLVAQSETNVEMRKIREIISKIY